MVALSLRVLNKTGEKDKQPKFYLATDWCLAHDITSLCLESFFYRAVAIISIYINNSDACTWKTLHECLLY